MWYFYQEDSGILDLVPCGIYSKKIQVPKVPCGIYNKKIHVQKVPCGIYNKKTIYKLHKKGTSKKD